jgi:hypothetical protein
MSALGQKQKLTLLSSLSPSALWGKAVMRTHVNALKHAFEPGATGNVLVSLTRSERQLTLVVEDEGKGCPQDAKGGVGSQLIGLLVGQLEGDVIRKPQKRGCRVSVSIPETSLRREDMGPCALYSVIQLWTEGSRWLLGHLGTLLSTVAVRTGRVLPLYSRCNGR